MSSEHLELVRSIFAAWERGDLSSGEWAGHESEFAIALTYFDRERAFADRGLKA
jgi:hypothetical protein